MQITQKYSHLNGEEYLIVHHKSLYDEIVNIITSVNAEDHRTKVSRESRKKGQTLYSPKAINKALHVKFAGYDWHESRYKYYITLNRALMEESLSIPYAKQKKYLIDHGQENPIKSYNQTDFVKEKIAVEVQFGKYPFVAYDLFVKHMLFYSGGVINLGIEVLPTKAMQSEMSSGVAYYEGEVYKVMRHGRNNPPVPLLILGVEP